MSAKPEEIKKLGGLASKKIILARLNVSKEEIDTIETVEEAQELIDFTAKQNVQLNNKPALPTPKPTVALNNAPPENTGNQVPYSAEELFDPRQVDVSRCNLLGQDEPGARILKLYDDATPEGRVI